MDQLSDAVVQSVQNGAYPESEDLSAAELASADLSSILDNLKKTRDEVKAEIKAISREVAPDVDTWIKQAKQLQQDIERSRNTAREIVAEAEAAKETRDAEHDAAKKVELLDTELAFSQKLQTTLASVKALADRLAEGQDSASKGELAPAFSKYREVEAALVDLQPASSTVAHELLRQRATRLRKTVEDEVEKHWSTLIKVDSVEGRITIQGNEGSNSEKSDGGLETTARLLADFDTLDRHVSRLRDDIDRIIITPRMTVRHGKVPIVEIQSGEIQIAGHKKNDGAVECMTTLKLITQFLSSNLPEIILEPLSKTLMQSISSRLTSGFLQDSVPVSIDQVAEFETLLEQTRSFATELEANGWSDNGELVEWVNQAAKNWLAKKREYSLLGVRSLLIHRIKDTKVVERVETQVVRDDDEVIAALNGSADDWDTNWSDEENDVGDGNTGNHEVEDEDEDTSAWDVDDDNGEGVANGTGNIKPQAVTEPNVEDDDGDAWGWEDNSPTSPTHPRSPVKTAKKNTNGNISKEPAGERELTLRETYTVTCIPDELREMIVRIAREAESLRNQDEDASPIVQAASGVFSIPTLMLAGFRALAPTHYTPIDGGSLYLYNDCMRLQSELAAYLENESSPTVVSKSKLEADVATLTSFGKRAYAREMESQRTILGDLLDGAQGFANCAEEPFASSCAAAVSATCDRVRDVAKLWRGILSRSALVQSLGSLVSTVAGKVIVDVEDLSDISEEESKRLKRFCDEVSKLGDLFAGGVAQTDNEAGEDASPQPQPDVSTIHNWFKLQYLSEILESNLADIKYLWQEGELKLEFEPDELVDLVEALFAESEHRRRAINDIRRG